MSRSSRDSSRNKILYSLELLGADPGLGQERLHPIFPLIIYKTTHFLCANLLPAQPISAHFT
ncbi:hypothetical protein LguiA_005145 [Lonicera macranthoides]